MDQSQNLDLPTISILMIQFCGLHISPLYYQSIIAGAFIYIILCTNATNSSPLCPVGRFGMLTWVNSVPQGCRRRKSHASRYCPDAAFQVQAGS